MSYDYSKLRGRIVERYGSNKNFAVALDITPAALSNKLGNKSSFSQGEINRACTLLGITEREIGSYFFMH